MRLYGKRFFANRMDSRISDRKESRDALVYDIDEANRWCRVRVAGSDVLVRAWFPTNFMRAPNWLKVNTAVRVAHVGGSKSRIEVVGTGLVQPTYAIAPQSGGGDAILLGMYPTAPIEGTDWNVEISSGTYRINGVTYAFDAGGGMVLGSGVELGSGVTLGEGFVIMPVDPIGAHDPGELWFRYDAFVIGADGVIDYVKGTEVEYTSGSSGPVKPSVPSGHVLIRNYILVWTGLTAISQANIGMEWAAPHPERLEVSYSYAEPFFTPTEKYVQMEGGIGVIYGGPDVYEGTPRVGAIGNDMGASANITVINQYGLPHSWWTDGSINIMAVSFLGIASLGGYGAVGLPFPYPDVPAVADDSGYGEEAQYVMGLGSTMTITYTRQHTVIAQPDPGQDGYASYAQADADSHTATVQVRLVSAEAAHPVSAILTFWNLDGDGHPM